MLGLLIKNFTEYVIVPLGNGISDEYHVIRHVMNLEAVNTYEGKPVHSQYNTIMA